MPEDRPRAWERLDSKDGPEFSIFKVRTEHARSPRTGEVEELNIVEAADGVTVLALTEGGELVMVEQYRHGTRTVTLETPSGFMDPGEEPIEAALRELREETGYEGGEARVIGRMELNPSWQTTLVHVVEVRGVRRSAERELDDAEDIRVLTLPQERVMELARAGGIRATVALGALALFQWNDEGRKG